jgi:hypothetical protein
MPLACQLIVQLACSRWPTAKAGQWAKAEQSLGGQTIRRSREKNRTARRVVVRRGCASVAKPPGPVPPLVHSASSHTRLFFIRWNQGPARRVGRGGGGNEEEVKGLSPPSGSGTLSSATSCSQGFINYRGINHVEILAPRLCCVLQRAALPPLAEVRCTLSPATDPIVRDAAPPCLGWTPHHSR